MTIINQYTVFIYHSNNQCEQITEVFTARYTEWGTLAYITAEGSFETNLPSKLLITKKELL